MSETARERCMRDYRDKLLGENRRTRIRDHWQEHGPRLLAVLKRVQDLSKAGSSVDAVRLIGDTDEAIAAAEKVPGDE